MRAFIASLSKKTKPITTVVLHYPPPKHFLIFLFIFMELNSKNSKKWKMELINQNLGTNTN